MCEEQQCEEQVFPLAVSYMDRFLAQRAISRQQLQLLAVTALLLASKFRQCHPLSVDLLCAYTDNSVYPHEVRVSVDFSVFLYNFSSQFALMSFKATLITMFLGSSGSLGTIQVP